MRECVREGISEWMNAWINNRTQCVRKYKCVSKSGGVRRFTQVQTVSSMRSLNINEQWGMDQDHSGRGNIENWREGRRERYWSLFIWLSFWTVLTWITPFLPLVKLNTIGNLFVHNSTIYICKVWGWAPVLIVWLWFKCCVCVCLCVCERAGFCEL